VSLTYWQLQAKGSVICIQKRLTLSLETWTSFDSYPYPKPIIILRVGIMEASYLCLSFYLHAWGASEWGMRSAVINHKSWEVVSGERRAYKFLSILGPTQRVVSSVQAQTRKRGYKSHHCVVLKATSEACSCVSSCELYWPQNWPILGTLSIWNFFFKILVAWEDFSTSFGLSYLKRWCLSRVKLKLIYSWIGSRSFLRLPNGLLCLSFSIGVWHEFKERGKYF
jgi:hypothetical protein